MQQPSCPALSRSDFDICPPRMLGRTLVCRLVLMCLWSSAAMGTSSCFPLLAQRRHGQTCSTFWGYSHHSKQVTRYQRIYPRSLLQKVISMRVVPCHKVLRSVLPVLVRWPARELSKHSYGTREHEGRPAIAGERPSSSVTFVQNRSRTARTGGGGNVCGATWAAQGEVTVPRKLLPSIQNCADEGRKVGTLCENLLVRHRNDTASSAAARESTMPGKLEQPPSHLALGEPSANTPVKKAGVERPQRKPVFYADILLRQLQQSSTISSDALEVAFPRRYDRVSFRERVLSTLRQKVMCAMLGVTDVPAHKKDLTVPDSCSEPPSKRPHNPLVKAGLQGEEVEGIKASDQTTSGDKEKRLRRTRTGAKGSTSGPISPTRSVSLTARTPGRDASSTGSLLDLVCSVSGMDTVDAPPARAEAAGPSTNKALGKGPLHGTQKSSAAARHYASGKAPAMTAAPENSEKPQTASESLRKELGLQNRSDIVVQHISDLQRCPLILRRQKTFKRRTKLRYFTA